jgi:4'-phosphopantetheinyl transferase
MPAEIHVWLASWDEITDENLHDAYRDLLSSDERCQENRFYFAKDRRRYLVSRALVRTVLSRYLSIEPQDWEFSRNAYGRPEIANKAARSARLSFSLSHTQNLAALGVTRSRAVGVDIEHHQAREVATEIADRYFAAEEAAALRAVPPESKQLRFFEYWTLKESYIKARGMGMSLSLDKFSFHFAGAQALEMSISPELDDDPCRWQFWQFRPAPEYMLAICAERIGAQGNQVIFRQVIPMLSEEVVAGQCVRASRQVTV